jgi:hypothetical protein
MPRKSVLSTIIVVIIILLSVSLEAYLEEALRMPWPGFQILEGHWQARNGTGVMAIKNINATGSIEMNYFDVEPVHVTQAQAGRDGKVTKIQVFLRYSDSLCCTYDLTYDPQSDQLKGFLWQKGNSKSKEVIFTRIRPME